MDMAFAYNLCLWFILIISALSFPSLFFFTAPYGRHAIKGWKFNMNYKIGWLIMEVPPPVVFAVIFFQGKNAIELVPLIFLGIWESHYFYRSIVFPLRLGNKGKTKPVAAVLVGFLFNMINGFMNAYAITNLAPHLLSAGWLNDPRFIIGIALIVIGFTTNVHSDAVLRGLRKPGEAGYKIPYGGMYRWVSCPNYLGEITEWTGFAIATWTSAGLAFALFTIANLFPRAFSHHRWYRKHFPDYPKDRKVIIPGIL